MTPENKATKPVPVVGYDSSQVIEEAQAIKPAKVSQAQAKKRSDVLEIPVQKAVESGRSPNLIGEVCSSFLWLKLKFCLMHVKM